MNDRQLGRFSVTSDMVRTNPDAVASIFSLLGVVIVRAEQSFARQEIEYIGLSNQFEEVELGTIIPEYSITIRSEEDEIVEVTAERHILQAKGIKLKY